MPRKPKAQPQPPPPTDEPPRNINPYSVLGLPSTATPAEIRSSYLKLALQLHPDKAGPSASESEKATAHTAFQSLAFAYSVLSDPARKARYDATGSTSDRPEADEFFDWASFYRSQFKEVVTTAHIEEFRAKYQGSEEERGDVLAAYVDGQGSVEAVFESVMCSEEERDLERFRGMVEEAVRGGEVERFERFWEDEGSGKRIKKRKGEEQEARELARKLGVSSVPDTDLPALEALIRSRQKNRFADLISNIEDRYGKGRGKKRGRK
ncbi:DnaJ protein, subfamily C, member 9 [Tirmania nivea]|nr:DnaJ protein, subfamily C, member 9 [Tirmania nivea]